MRALALALILLPTAALAEGDASQIVCADFKADMTRALAAAPDSLQVNALLFDAARRGCASALPDLFSAGASPLARDRQGQGALAIAARAGRMGVVEVLLRADPQTVASELNRPDVEGATPLLSAAVAGRGAVALRLVEAGADVNAADRHNETPLAAAAYRKDLALFDALIAKGAKIDVVDASGKTPMIYAAAEGETAMVARLLDLGIDPDARYGAELTALMWAAGHAPDADAGQALETAKLLLARGAKPDRVDDRGMSALMIAAELGHDELVKLLIGCGADPTIRDKHGRAAEDLAVSDELKALLRGR